MSSTGGLDLDGYDITDTPPKRMKGYCHMCQLLWGRLPSDEQHALHNMR